MSACQAESRYRNMWQLVLFDLPVKTKAERRRATAFRKGLLREGYIMLQFSVYAAHCESAEHGLARRNTVRGLLPLAGQVRMLAVTDRQFSDMQSYVGKKPAKTEAPPEQMMLF